MIPNIKIPKPADYRTWQQWADALRALLQFDDRLDARNNPLPVLLPHKLSDIDNRAAADGVLMYDPILGSVVVSQNGVWVPMQSTFAMTYAERQVLNDFSDTVSVLNTARSLFKFGLNADIDTGATETVWATGGDESYLANSVNTIDTIVSANAGDNASVTIIGFTNASGVLTKVTQSATLNGTTNVTLSTPLNRVEDAYVTGYASNVLGDVTITDNGGGTTHLTIPAGRAISSKAAVSTANGEYLFITGLRGGADTAVDARLAFDLEVRKLGEVFRIMTPTLYSTAVGTPYFDVQFDRPLIVEPNSDVRVRCTTSLDNASVTAMLSGVYAEVQ